MKPIRNGLAIVCLLTSFSGVYAQSDTTFFDRKWKYTDREHASFYRPPAVQKDGLYCITDYFMNGRVQMTGSFSNMSCSIEEGYFVHYDSLGNKTYEGLKHKGNRTGEWKYYFAPSAQLKQTRNFATDILNGHAVNYDSATGRKKVEGDYCNGLRCGKWLEYYDGSDSVQFEVNYREGSMNGKVRSFYRDGKLKRDDIYESGRFVSGKCFDSDGGKVKHTVFYEPPKFDGDVIGFFLERIHYPAEAAQNNIDGSVKLGFTVEKNGHITDVRIIEGLGYGCDEEALRVMRLMPPWKPARLEGEIVEEHIMRGIHFPFKAGIFD